MIILNAPPLVADVTLSDRWGPLFGGIDPGAEVWLDATVADNNTISDILLIRVTLRLAGSGDADSPGDRYTLTWTPTSGFEGDSLVVQGCRAPSDQDAVEGTWRFAFRLSRTALASSAWTCEISATDEERSGSRRRTFSVNEFTSVTFTAKDISLSGTPGSLVPAVENPFQIHYLSNHPFEVGVRATPFIGSQSPEFVIEPERFTVSSSPDASQGLILSSARGVLVVSAPGEGNLGLHIFASIPDPFLDQDYRGEIIFDLRPRGEG